MLYVLQRVGKSKRPCCLMMTTQALTAASMAMENLWDQERSLRHIRILD
jgi:hypothetical protein